MKFAFLFLLLLCNVYSDINAQILNGGFEDWTDSTKPPDGWKIYGGFKDNNNGEGWYRGTGHSGKYSFYFQELPIMYDGIISGKFKLFASAKILKFWYQANYPSESPLEFHYKSELDSFTFQLALTQGWTIFILNVTPSGKIGDSIFIKFSVPLGPPPDFSGGIICSIDDVNLDSLQDYVSLDEKNLFSISPNLISSHANLKYHLDGHAPINASLFDLTGREVLKLPSLNDAGGEGSIPFDVDEIPNGMYYLKADARGKIFVEKIIVQH